ncbi:TraR/DksA family transcriptional regulator [Ramlibacter sp.]|uniref:TraR/DksA family transcriptional regulator n=1 Tax=Ramlibacter sp. TaxID=1917967 RepID=UPI003D14DB9E
MTRPDPTLLHARFQALLDRREADLRRAIATDLHASSHEHDRTEVQDRKDFAEEDTQAIVDEALTTRAASELEAIAAARRRIADGSYGTCLSCGEAIGEQRLLAVPAAPLCTRCQADAE